MGIALSLDENFVGQPTPVEAAQWFVVQSWNAAWAVPAGAVWTVGDPEPLGVTVTTDSVSLHAVQLPNKTWAIDSGERCN